MVRHHSMLLIMLAVALLCSSQGVAGQVEIEATKCPTGYNALNATASSVRCLCAESWGSWVPNWPLTNTKYPSIPPACRVYNPDVNTPYTSATSFPNSLGKCMCFPCPSGYWAVGGRLNTTLAACKKLIKFYVQLRIRSTASKICGSSVRFRTGAAITAGMNQVAGVDDRSLRAKGISCGLDSTAPAGTVRYLLQYEIAYLGSTAARTTILGVINGNRATGICRYGACTAVSTASNGTDTVVDGAAQNTKFAVPTAPCSPPKCNDRVCNTGTCNLVSGQCVYKATANGTACAIPGLVGKCMSGNCVGLMTSIKQATVGIGEPVVFSAKFPTSDFAGQRVFVRAAAADGTLRSQVFGELFDNGDPANYDLKAGDGVFTGTLDLTFASTGSSFYAAALQAGTSVTSTTPPTSITVFGRSSLPTASVESANTVAIARVQKQVNALVASGSTPKQAIDKVYQSLTGVKSASEDGGPDSEADFAMDVPADDSELALAAADVEPASAVNPEAVDINRRTVVRVSDRRIEFRTTDNLPGVVVATNNLDQKVCMDIASPADALRKLLASGKLDEVTSEAAGWAEDELGETPADALYGPYSRFYANRELLQSEKKCPFYRGKVLMMAPFIANFACFYQDKRYWKDELRPISFLYRRAGYLVTFKCNNPTPCPRGPPVLTDYTKWSSYAAVLLSAIGDSNDAGNNPIVLSRASLPVPANGTRTSTFAADWRSGRLLRHGLDGYALTPAWFQKYGVDGGEQIGSFIYFSVDRSARGPNPGFARTMMTAVPGSIGFTGYTDYVSRRFPEPRPGYVMTMHLLSNNGTVANFPCEGAKDENTGALFRTFVYESTSTLVDARSRQMYDRCRFMCNGVNCNTVTCITNAEPGYCNALSSTCDTSCSAACGRKDGDECMLRGFKSVCRGGQCRDICNSGFCDETDCLKLPNGTDSVLCSPRDGKCNLEPVSDGTLCQYYGDQQGSCQKGECLDLCVNVTCKAQVCQSSAFCDIGSGNCTGTPKPNGEACKVPVGQAGAGKDGSCSNGRCLPPVVNCANYIPTIVVNGPNVIVWADGRTGPTSWTSPTAITNPDCPDPVTITIAPIPEDCTVTPAGLAIRSVFGTYFMSCFTYAVGIGDDDNAPTVGPAISFEPLESYPGRTIYIKSIMFGEVYEVEDCLEVLTVTISNSLGTTSLPLPCMPDTFGPHDFDTKVPIPQGEKSELRFTGMSGGHVLSISRLYYSVEATPSA